MVARTLPFKSPDKPNEELPSISAEMQRQIEAAQTDIKKQVKHATSNWLKPTYMQAGEASSPGSRRSTIGYLSAFWRCVTLRLA
jgi:hypothetical protein